MSKNLLLVLLMSLCAYALNAQSGVRILINKTQANPNQRTLTVNSTDNIQIIITLPSGIPPEQFLPKTGIVLKSCKPILQNQQQVQQAQDNVENLAQWLNRKQGTGKRVMESSYYNADPAKKTISISFRADDISQCPRRNFWIKLNPNKQFLKRTKEIPGFQNEYTFYRLK